MKRTATHDPQRHRPSDEPARAAPRLSEERRSTARTGPRWLQHVRAQCKKGWGRTHARGRFEESDTSARAASPNGAHARSEAHPAGAQRVHSVPASTRWPRAAHSTKEKTRRRTHARTARTEEADPPVRENQTQGDEASAEGHGQSDTPAAAARMAMVCRATRRAASNELPAARRAPAARVGLHQTLATSRETVHTIQMLWHERTPVPTTDPRGLGRPHCHALGRRNSRDTEALQGRERHQHRLQHGRRRRL